MKRSSVCKMVATGVVCALNGPVQGSPYQSPFQAVIPPPTIEVPQELPADTEAGGLSEPHRKVRNLMRSLDSRMKRVEATFHEYEAEVAPINEVESMIEILEEMRPDLMKLLDLVPPSMLSLEQRNPDLFRVRVSEFRLYGLRTLERFGQLDLYLKRFLYSAEDEESYFKAVELYFQKIIPLIKVAHQKFG